MKRFDFSFRIFLLAWLPLFWVSISMGQTPGSTPANADEEIEELEAFIGNDVPIEDSILPTTRPFDSVYGTSRSIIETPRNVTIISREQLDAIDIQSVRDITKLTSSAYSRTNFGAPTVPDIRTQIADQYHNGMRMGLTSNGNGLPVNWNSVESVNILKGPATVVHGGSQYIGGYMDLITKRPYFDAFRGFASFTLGTEDVYRWTLDVGGPISENTAYRISYSGENSDGWYENEYRHSHALYGAVTYEPNDNYELFLNGEIYYGNYTENFGYNRVTQSLIDDFLYSTGTNINNGTVATPSDPQNAENSLSGFPVPNTIAWTGATRLGERQRLLRPGDDSEGVQMKLQAIQTWNLSPDSKIINNTFYNYIARETLSSYLYSEIIDPSWVIENRFEYITDITSGENQHSFNVGGSIRYQEVEAYNDFFNEPAAVWDLTKQISGVDFTRSSAYPGIAVPVPGWPGRFATPGQLNGDTNDSEALNIGPFVHYTGRYGDKFILDAGVRYEYMDVTSADPLAGTLPFIAPEFEESADVWLHNYNASVTYMVNKQVSLYATYQESENPAGQIGNGGGIAVGLDEQALQTEANLIEAGAKFSFLENTLFASFAIYNQERINRNQDGSQTQFDTTGVEIEFNYQPSRNFYLTAAWTGVESKADNVQFYVTNTFDYFNPATGQVEPRIDQGTFITGWINNGSPELDRQGVPEHVINGMVNYKFDSGWGFNTGIVITGPIRQNVIGTLEIPWQHTIDASVFYEAEKWAARLRVSNLTDESNWSPPNAVYSDESILLEPGTMATLSFTYFFGADR